jgi:hypothetical protein
MQQLIDGSETSDTPSTDNCNFVDSHRFGIPDVHHYLTNDVVAVPLRKDFIIL